MAKKLGYEVSEKEKRRIRGERRKLRIRLWKEGITKHDDFEDIAAYQNLYYKKRNPFSFGLFRRLNNFLKSLKPGHYLLIGFLILLLVFPLSVIAMQKGNFMITMTSDLINSGMKLSAKEDLSDGRARLTSNILQEVNPYCMMDMPDNLNEGEGSHNMDDVVVYSFWITNDSETDQGFDWYLVLNDATSEVDKATWQMIYDDGKQLVYAEEREDGTPEEINGCTWPPLQSQSADPGNEYRYDGPEDYAVIALPYVEGQIIATGSVESMKPGESRKYTVVIWIEGRDPDCTQQLIAGHSGYNMHFTAPGDTEDVYKKYGRDSAETETLRGNLAEWLQNFFSGNKTDNTGSTESSESGN